MIATNFATDLSCGDIVRLIKAVVRGGYDVLNMSYGAAQECFAESAELQRATAAGVLLVAAAGNEFAEGNPLEYPASLPHVVTVAAVDLEGQTSYFSNANAAVDLAAPGERVANGRPARVRSRWRRQWLRAARRHELRGPDRGRGRGVGGGGAAEADRGPARAGGQAVGDRPRPRRLGPEHGLRARPGRQGAALERAQERPARAQRGHLLGERRDLPRPPIRSCTTESRAGGASARAWTSTRTRRTSTGSGSRAIRERGSAPSRATATPTSRSTTAARTARPTLRSGSRSARAPCAIRS